MRAVVVREFGPPERLGVEDVPAPAAGAGEVLIDVKAIGVNFPDLLVVRGTYQILPDPPFSPGKEVAGVVVASGPDVAGLAAGDRVMAQLEYGGYGEQVVARAGNCFRLPDEIGYEEAAAFGLVYVTAHLALDHRAGLRAGETVLVTGAGGGIGSAGVLLAKALGARVIAVADTPEKRALAAEQGADHAIDADPASLRDAVLGLTGGRGADVVLEAVGGDVFAACLRCTAWEGRVVVIGFASGEIPRIHAGHLLVKNISVLDLQSSDYRDRDHAAFGAAVEHVLALYRRGAITIPLTATYPLERAADALRAIERGEVKGKVVLTTGT
jgi:NADPH:quinone reductase